MDNIVAIVGAVIAVIAICVAGTYFYSTVNGAYYAGMRNCTEHGGLWIPSHDSNAICIIRVK